LKERSTEQVLNELAGLLQLLPLFIFFAFQSCNHRAGQQIEAEIADKLQATIPMIKESFAPPKITYITTSNQPKKVPAGNPNVRLVSSNAGAPVFKNYGREQGFDQIVVFTGTADRSGALWFGTPYGVIRQETCGSVPIMRVSSFMMENNSPILIPRMVCRIILFYQ